MYANPDYNIYLYGSIHFLSNLIVILNQFENQKKTKKDENNNNLPPPQKTTSTQKTKQQQQLRTNILFNPLQLSLNFSLMRH